MIRSSLCLGLIAITSMGCSRLVQAPPPGDEGMIQEAAEWLEALPDYSSLPAETRERWAASAGEHMEAQLSEQSFEQLLESDAQAVKGVSSAMSDLVNAGFHEGAVPPGLDSALIAGLLVQAHSPSLILKLVGPAFAEGEVLEDALTEGDADLAGMLENPDGIEGDPSFALYLQAIEATGLNSPVSKALIERMFHARPLRAMDIMLSRYPASLPDAIRIFGIHQGVRLRVMLQGIGQARTNETFEWMMRELSPLREHETWWVRNYAARVLELGVNGKLYLDGAPQ